MESGCDRTGGYRPAVVDRLASRCTPSAEDIYPASDARRAPGDRSRAARPAPRPGNHLARAAHRALHRCVERRRGGDHPGRRGRLRAEGRQTDARLAGELLLQAVSVFLNYLRFPEQKKK